MQKTLYIGLDVHQTSISVSVAEDGRDGQVRFVGEIPNVPTDIAKLAKRLAKKGEKLEFCYEAGCCGYIIYRQLIDLGHGCMVIAPSKIPKKPGDRIKNDRRDSQKLAVLHRAGDLTSVWVPDAVHEAMRDLVRARMNAVTQLSRARHQLLSFLLRHGRIYHNTGGKLYWIRRHFLWLAAQTFEQPALQIVFQDYVNTVLAAKERCDQLLKQITSLFPLWSMGPVVEAVRCLRGMETISAVTFVAAVGDFSRFESPSHLMAYLGLVPSQHSSGDTIKHGGITKTGNREARRMLVEAAWSYRYPARVAKAKFDIMRTLPTAVRDIAWKAQMRLCARYRKLLARGKKPNVATVAIARELSGFIWAIGQEVKPAML